VTVVFTEVEVIEDCQTYLAAEVIPSPPPAGIYYGTGTVPGTYTGTNMPGTTGTGTMGTMGTGTGTMGTGTNMPGTYTCDPTIYPGGLCPGSSYSGRQLRALEALSPSADEGAEQQLLRLLRHLIIQTNTLPSDAQPDAQAAGDAAASKSISRGRPADEHLKRYSVNNGGEQAPSTAASDPLPDSDEWPDAFGSHPLRRATHLTPSPSAPPSPPATVQRCTQQYTASPSASTGRSNAEQLLRSTTDARFVALQAALRNLSLPTADLYLNITLNGALSFSQLDSTEVYSQRPSPSPPPPSPPPPQPPPQPPAFPPGLCLNTCVHTSCGGSCANNHVCEDGGAGATTDICALGTDCDDCRPPTADADGNTVPFRKFCTSCPEACQLNNARVSDPRNACLESMLGDRICQTQCNNRACAYDSIVSTANGGVQYDCTPDQISTPCLVAEAQSADSLRESPGASTSTLVPVAFQLAMSPGRLSIDGDINEMMWHQELDYKLQWSDNRLWTAHCAGALAPRLSALGTGNVVAPSFVSMDKLTSQSEALRDTSISRQRGYWIPRVDFDQSTEDIFDSTVNFDMNYNPHNATVGSTRPWLVSDANGQPVTPTGVSTAACERCVEWEGSLDLQIVQRVDYFFFPFDMQTIELLLKIDDNVDLYTCEGGGAPTPSLADENYTMLSGQATGSNSQKARLIVASQEWLLHRNDFTSAISMAHPRNGQTPIRNQCRIKIMLSRVSLPFVVKSIVLTIFIVFGSLGFAVLLHPDELIGDRAAVLFVAFLILATNIQTDLGLGTVSYLLWVDIFNGIQLTIIFGVILQTMLAHSMVKYSTGRTQDIGYQFDGVCCITMPTLYALITFILCLYGAAGSNLGTATGCLVLCIIVSVAWVCVTVVWTSQRVLEKECVRDRALVAMKSTDPADEDAFRKVAKQIFRAFDKDGSASIDLAEARVLFRHLYPGLSSEQMRLAVSELLESLQGVDELDQDSFLDALHFLEKWVHEHVEHYDELKSEELAVLRQQMESREANKPWYFKMADRTAAFFRGLMPTITIDDFDETSSTWKKAAQMDSKHPTIKSREFSSRSKHHASKQQLISQPSAELNAASTSSTHIPEMAKDVSSASSAAPASAQLAWLKQAEAPA